MGRKNRSISIPEDLSEQIDEAAAAADVTPSAWLVDAARRRLKIDEGLRAMDEFFAEAGPPTPEEEAWVAEAYAQAAAANRAHRDAQAQDEELAS